MDPNSISHPPPPTVPNISSAVPFILEPNNHVVSPFPFSNPNPNPAPPPAPAPNHPPYAEVRLFPMLCM